MKNTEKRCFMCGKVKARMSFWGSQGYLCCACLNEKKKLWKPISSGLVQISENLLTPSMGVRVSNNLGGFGFEGVAR